MADRLQQLVDRVNDARENSRRLYLQGGDSKRALIGRDCQTDSTLDLSGHTGICDYQPRELVLSARAGTRISELQTTLEAQGQMLPFEPPQFGDHATLGGTLACNLSGPARPWQGSIRDAVLGVQLINGRGNTLEIGGKVMKNVAGYDVSRLQAGALGTLGAITEVHIKVLPMPETSVTLAWELSAEEALLQMTEKAALPKPLTGACWVDGRLYLRLSGADSAVRHTARHWGGERVDNLIWQQLREMTHPFFADQAPLWRLSLSAAAPLHSGVDQCLDWGGAQRWFRDRPDQVPDGAHLSLFSGGDRTSETRGTLDPVQRKLQLRLKQAFDPEGIFNPGRLYSWM